ncbi:MAG: sigma-54-dependent Fis family transcriptional regulator [Bacteroidetes bacterium]|nr:MAG: sigma-54-dependent Fis family transcriptional regulator [Bacteroidota bacterium]
MQHKILIVDDDVAVRTSLELLLRKAGYVCEVAAAPQEALNSIRSGKINAALLDMNYALETSGEEGLELLQKIKILHPLLPVILISGWGSIELAVQGMRLGAFSFVSKPWNNQSLLSTLQAALALSQPDDTPDPGRKELNSRFDLDSIVGDSPRLVKLLQTLGRIASNDAPVLVTGESGTGKELVAEAIHHNSHRKKGAFVKVNLGGISSSLFESEMFGHRKGAFTDAYTDRVGRFELARGGTIFLDEIAELDPACQVKLLRVLQEKTYEVLGDSTPQQSDVRVICATNRNLRQMVEKGLFREDLFYRINVISLELPPLRERPGDIPLLARHFALQLTRGQQLPTVHFSSEVLKWLKGLPFPGNIRELKNLIERVILVSGKQSLAIDDFTEQYQGAPLSAHANPLDSPGMLTLEQMEKLMIEKAIKAFNNNIAKVARSLGLSRGALYRRMDKYNIPYESES